MPVATASSITEIATRRAHWERQKRIFDPSAAVHKHTARPTVPRAVTRDCYAANDAKSP